MLDFTKAKITDREAYEGFGGARLLEAQLMITAGVRMDMSFHGQINVPKMTADRLRMELFHLVYGDLLRPLAELQSLVYRQIPPLQLADAEKLFAEINGRLEAARTGGEHNGPKNEKEKMLQMTLDGE